MAEKTPQDPPTSAPSSASQDPDTCPNPKKRKNSSITLEKVDSIKPPPANSFTFDTVFSGTPENTPKFGSFNISPEPDCVGILNPRTTNSATDFPVYSATTAATTITRDCGPETHTKKRKKEDEESEERIESSIVD